MDEEEEYFEEPIPQDYIEEIASFLGYIPSSEKLDPIIIRIPIIPLVIIFSSDLSLLVQSSDTN
jgi:hypothetical protein